LGEDCRVPGKPGVASQRAARGICSGLTLLWGFLSAPVDHALAQTRGGPAEVLAQIQSGAAEALAPTRSGPAEAVAPTRGGLSEQDFLIDLPIVLSVARLAQPFSEAPSATTVIDREMIRASGFRDLADVLRLVPGFLVGHDNGNSPVVAYPGLSGQFSRQMQVLVDGRSVYLPSNGGVEWSNIPLALDDVERIEVIRGPNSATYGANSFFGVINILTRRPGQDSGLALNLVQGGGEIADRSVRFSGHSGRLDYRLRAATLHDEGFEARFDSRRVKLATFSADYQASDADQLQFQGGYNGGTRDSGFPGAAGDGTRSRKIENYFTQLRWHRNVAPGNEFALQYYHSHDRTIDEYDALVPPPLRRLPIDFNVTSDRDDVEFQHNLSLNSTLRMVWGAELRHDKIHSPRLFSGSGDVSTSLSRFFSNAEWRLTPELILNAGAMLEHTDLAGNHVLPKVSLNYHVGHGQTLRAGLSHAIRSPVLLEEKADTKFTVGGRIVDLTLFSNGNLKVEAVDSAELGYVYEVPERKLFLDLRVHQDQVKDLITLVDASVPGSRDNVDGRAQTFVNRDSARVSGFEAQVRYHPWQDTRFVFNYAYTHIASEDRVDRISQSAPRHNFGLLAMHRLPSDYYASLGFYRVSSMEWLGAGDKVNGYSKLDLRLGRRFKAAGANGEVAVVVQNLLGEYQDFRTVNAAQRRVYLSLAMEF
jgi:iron complex outermembrane recepter protein